MSRQRLRPAGLLILILSGLGLPLSQLAIRIFGRGGAVLVEGVSSALLVRDAFLVASGAPARLRPAAAVMLFVELGAALIATLLGLRTLTRGGSMEATKRNPGPAEELRRTALGTLFGVHTGRFAIYLSPERGLRTRPADHASDA